MLQVASSYTAAGSAVALFATVRADGLSIVECAAVTDTPGITITAVDVTTTVVTAALQQE